MLKKILGWVLRRPWELMEKEASMVTSWFLIWVNSWMSGSGVQRRSLAEDRDLGVTSVCLVVTTVHRCDWNCLRKRVKVRGKGTSSSLRVQHLRFEEERGSTQGYQRYQRSCLIFSQRGSVCSTCSEQARSRKERNFCDLLSETLSSVALFLAKPFCFTYGHCSLARSLLSWAHHSIPHPCQGWCFWVEDRSAGASDTGVPGIETVLAWLFCPFSSALKSGIFRGIMVSWRKVRFQW